jgi:phage tail-like protein
MTHELGEHAGRVASTDSVSFVDGAHAFVLGSDAPGQRRKVSAGELFEARQRADWTDGAHSLLRVRARLRGTREASAGIWRLTVTRDGTERAAYYLSSSDGAGDGSRERVVADLAVPLLGIVTADSDLGFRLTLATGSGELDLELPAAYLEALTLDDSTSPVLINRRPEPGQRDVQVGGPDSLAQLWGLNAELHVPSAGIGSATGTTAELWVGGALAWSTAGGDEPGYTTSASFIDSGRTLALSTTLGDPLPPSSEVVVRLRAVLPGGAVHDESWSFWTEDLTAPELVSALAVSPTAVRVTASEPLLAEDPAGEADALNVANWALELRSTTLDDGLPAVTPVVVGVSRVSGAVFDLALDREMTPGALYAAVAGPVVDLAFAENPLAPPTNEVTFSGYAPARPAGRSFELLDLLPDVNVAEDETEDLRRFVLCLQEVTDGLLYDVDRWTDVLDPDVAPRGFLRAMLADLGNPFTFPLSEADERRLVRVLVPIYQLKGTVPGIVNAVRFFVGLEVEVVVPAFDAVWDLGVGELGATTWLGTSDLRDRLSFWIRSAAALTDEQRARIGQIANYMKRAEEHFRGFIEPAPPPELPNHWELGLSLLGEDTLLH